VGEHVKEVARKAFDLIGAHVVSFGYRVHFK
jgi:hypothetical protein